MKFTDSQLLSGAFEGKKQLRNSGLNYDRLEKSGIEPGKRYYINNKKRLDVICISVYNRYCNKERELSK